MINQVGIAVVPTPGPCDEGARRDCGFVFYTDEINSVLNKFAAYSTTMVGIVSLSDEDHVTAAVKEGGSFEDTLNRSLEAPGIAGV